MANIYNFADRAATFGAMPQQKAMFSFGAMPDMPDIQEPEPMPEPQRDKAFTDAQSRYEKIRQANQLDENGMTADGKMWRGGPKTRLFVAQNGGKEIVMKDANLMKQLNAITIAENRELGGFAPLEDNAPQANTYGPVPEGKGVSQATWERANAIIEGKEKAANAEEQKFATEIVNPQYSERALKKQGLEDKRKAAEAAQRQSIEDARDTANSALNTIRKLQTNLGDGWLPETGLTGSLLSHVKGTDAYNLEQDLNSLRGIIGLNSLMQAKAGSANGASGFGALSEKELALLQNKLGALDAGMGKERLAEALNEIAPLFQRALVSRNIDDSSLVTPVQQQPRGVDAPPPGFIEN